MKKIILNSLATSLGIIIISFGIALTLKSDIGTGSINAVSSSIGWATHIHVGTILMWVNMSCVVVQLILLKKDFHWRQWLQVGVSMLLGNVVNIFLYHVLSNVTVENYFIKMILFLCGTLISCFGISVVIRLNLIAVPVESMAIVLANMTGKSFRVIRQWIDIVSLSVSVTLTLLFPIEWAVREGTVINVLIFSHIIQFFIHFIEKQGWFSTIRISD